MSIIDEILRLYKCRGNVPYLLEQVTQTEHAIQAGMAAEQAGASSSLISGAFLHDMGHVLRASHEETNDEHERIGYEWLRQYFDLDVIDPVRMHVSAKRYLCAADPDYWDQLSDISKKTLEWQGGPFTEEEMREFESESFYEEAIQVRRWCDRAKKVDIRMPSLEHFRPHLEASLKHG